MNTRELEKQLWAAADKLRGNISSSDYKYVVLGLIFLKYVSDAFSVRYQAAIDENYDPEDRDWYLAENVFWIPKEARWEHLVANAKQPEIGVLVDGAMEAIERDNPSLKGVLPKNYAREALDKRRLGELIDLFTNIKFDTASSKDLLGQVYEYFMGMFADSEGKHGGEFYTPRSIVRLLVEMLEPYRGRVYDPCCGSGGMFVWSENFVEEHAVSGRRNGALGVRGRFHERPAHVPALSQQRGRGQRGALCAAHGALAALRGAGRARRGLRAGGAGSAARARLTRWQ